MTKGGNTLLCLETTTNPRTCALKQQQHELSNKPVCEDDFQEVARHETAAAGSGITHFLHGELWQR